MTTNIIVIATSSLLTGLYLVMFLIIFRLSTVIISLSVRGACRRQKENFRSVTEKR